MKGLKIVLGSLVFAASLVSFCVSGAGAANYLGEFCWQYQSTIEPAVSGVFKMAVNDMGGSHYLLNGRIIDIGGDIFAVNGNAELDGTQIFMTLSDAAVNGDLTWGDHLNAVLDQTTLSGAMSIVGVEYYSHTDTFDHMYDKGTLTFITCP